MGELGRQEKKAEFQIPESPPLIRSIDHLHKGWQKAGQFKGALLSEDAWEYFCQRL